jgi:hypothetical protein
VAAVSVLWQFERVRGTAVIPNATSDASSRSAAGDDGDGGDASRRISDCWARFESGSRHSLKPRSGRVFVLEAVSVPPVVPPPASGGCRVRSHRPEAASARESLAPARRRGPARSFIRRRRPNASKSQRAGRGWPSSSPKACGGPAATEIPRVSSSLVYRHSVPLTAKSRLPASSTVSAGNQSSWCFARLGLLQVHVIHVGGAGGDQRRPGRRSILGRDAKCLGHQVC